MSRLRLTIAFTALAVLYWPWASSQVERSGGGVNAQIAQQYQQALSERNQLQSDNAKLKKDLDDAKAQAKALEAQLGPLKAAATTSQSALAAAQASSQSSAQSLEQAKARMQELIERFREAATTLRNTENERSQLQQQLATSKDANDQCSERNVKLSELNTEVLDRYAHQGMFAHIAQAEPFTRIERARIDNLVLEDKQRVEALRVQRQPPSSGTPSAPAAQPAPQGSAAPASSPPAQR